MFGNEAKQLTCSGSGSPVLRWCVSNDLWLAVQSGGTAAAAPPPFRPGNHALCGSRPLVAPYNCRLGELLCYSCMLLYLFHMFVCVCMCDFCFLCFLGFFPLQLPPSVLWYCWLGLLTCKNRLPYNLHCVGEDVKHCSIQSSSPCTLMSLRLMSSVGRHPLGCCLASFPTATDRARWVPCIVSWRRMNWLFVDPFLRQAQITFWD